ncbi:MAG TPA: response regulator transcription factor [Acidimicrobiales bacterium]
MSRLVIIEDDPRISSVLCRSLIDREHDVRLSETGLDGLQHALDDDPDVVVLDLGLPDIDGLELLKMIRAVSKVPVIVATARDDDHEVVRTLDIGADDYVVKPFSVEQLEARIRAVLRRAGTVVDEPVRVGELSIDVASRTAVLAGEELELAPKEFDLLAYLAEREGQVISKRELLGEIWHQPYGGSEKSIDVHLSWLRSKLGETASEPRYLRSVRGVGVKLVEPG